MSNPKADMLQWARAQRRVAQRIAQEARKGMPVFTVALEHVDELRAFADKLGASVERAHAERENLAYHLAWKQARRAFGIG